ARHFDVAPGLRTEAIHLGEAESRADAGWLGREEGLEGAVQGVGAHTRTVVRNRDHRVAERISFGAFTGPSRPGVDADAALVSHGIAGIGDQVDERHLELGY